METTRFQVWLTDNKEAVCLSLTQNGVTLSEDLSAPELDLLIDALTEFRGQIQS